jgi:serine/threonine-protein kinase
MAEVWLAERADGAFERQVAIQAALSAIPRATSASASSSASALSATSSPRWQHPNIAGLHDAGVTPGGQPWLALEYVRGEPITAWCDTRAVAIEARVEVFVRSCARSRMLMPTSSSIAT